MNLVSMSMVPVFQSQFVQNTERNVTRFRRSYLGLVCCRRWIVAQSAAVEWRLEVFVARETRTEARGSGEGPRQGRGGRYVIGSLHIRWKLHHITKIIVLVPVAHKSLDIIIIVFMVSYLYFITLYPHRSLGGVTHFVEQTVNRFGLEGRRRSLCVQVTPMTWSGSVSVLWRWRSSTMTSVNSCSSWWGCLM